MLLLLFIGCSLFTICSVRTLHRDLIEPSQHSSLWADSITIPVTQRTKNKDRRGLGSRPKSPSSCGPGNAAQAWFWPPPPSSLFEALFQGGPEPCVLRWDTGIVSTFPWRPLSTLPWVPDDINSTPAPCHCPQTSQSSHSSQGLEATPSPLPMSLWAAPALLNTHLCFISMRLTEIRQVTSWTAKGGVGWGSHLGE